MIVRVSDNDGKGHEMRRLRRKIPTNVGIFLIQYPVRRRGNCWVSAMKLIRPLKHTFLATTSLLASSRPYENVGLWRSAQFPKLAHSPECRTTPWQRKWLNLTVTEPVNQRLADEAERFAGWWFRNEPFPKLFVFAGARPVEASRTAKALVRFAQAASFPTCKKRLWNDRIPRSSYFTGQDLLSGCESPGYCLPEEVVEDSMLVLDNLKPEGDFSQDASNRLCQTLVRRERKFTLVITPLRPCDWAESFDDRVDHRLREHSVIVEFPSISGTSAN
jgi:hypothetical protein